MAKLRAAAISSSNEQERYLNFYGRSIQRLEHPLLMPITSYVDRTRISPPYSYEAKVYISQNVKYLARRAADTLNIDATTCSDRLLGGDEGILNSDDGYFESGDYVVEFVVLGSVDTLSIEERPKPWRSILVSR